MKTETQKIQNFPTTPVIPEQQNKSWIKFLFQLACVVPTAKIIKNITDFSDRISGLMEEVRGRSWGNGHGLSFEELEKLILPDSEIEDFTTDERTTVIEALQKIEEAKRSAAYSFTAQHRELTDTLSKALNQLLRRALILSPKNLIARIRQLETQISRDREHYENAVSELNTRYHIQMEKAARELSCQREIVARNASASFGRWLAMLYAFVVLAAVWQIAPTITNPEKLFLNVSSLTVVVIGVTFAAFWGFYKFGSIGLIIATTGATFLLLALRPIAIFFFPILGRSTFFLNGTDLQLIILLPICIFIFSIATLFMGAKIPAELYKAAGKPQPVKAQFALFGGLVGIPIGLALGLGLQFISAILDQPVPISLFFSGFLGGVGGFILILLLVVFGRNIKNVLTFVRPTAAALAFTPYVFIVACGSWVLVELYNSPSRELEILEGARYYVPLPETLKGFENHLEGQPILELRFVNWREMDKILSSWSVSDKNGKKETFLWALKEEAVVVDQGKRLSGPPKNLPKRFYQSLTLKIPLGRPRLSRDGSIFFEGLGGEQIILKAGIFNFSPKRNLILEDLPGLRIRFQEQEKIKTGIRSCLEELGQLPVLDKSEVESYNNLSAPAPLIVSKPVFVLTTEELRQEKETLWRCKEVLKKTLKAIPASSR